MLFHALLTRSFRGVDAAGTQLRNLFAVARVLNRIPIVPPLECHCDRYWYGIGSMLGLEHLPGTSGHAYALPVSVTFARACE